MRKKTMALSRGDALAESSRRKNDALAAHGLAIRNLEKATARVRKAATYAVQFGLPFHVTELLETGINPTFLLDDALANGCVDKLRALMFAPYFHSITSSDSDIISQFVELIARVFVDNRHDIKLGYVLAKSMNICDSYLRTFCNVAEELIQNKENYGREDRLKLLIVETLSGLEDDEDFPPLEELDGLLLANDRIAELEAQPTSQHVVHRKRA